MLGNTRGTFRRVVASLTVALVAVAIPAAVASTDRHDLVSPLFAELALGGDVERLDNGLYRVTTPGGYVMTTHGPDTDALVGGHGDELGPGDPERAPVCGTGKVAHVLYGRPALIAPDRLAAVEEEIRAHIRRMNDVINESSVESGGPSADLRVLCDEQGRIRLDGFVNNLLVSYFSPIVDAARAAGFDDPMVDYIIFYDDNFPGVCGFGELAGDDRAGSSNRNNDGGYGVTYKSCWYSRTPLHENGHTQGAVQDAAPNHDGTSHCTEQQDIMCYPSTSNQCSIQHFDCGFDTYFDAAPEEGEWLASHWNIGDPANSYIQFGGSSSSSGSLIDPGARLQVSDLTPPRGSRVEARAYLKDCSVVTGTVIQLQRKVEGKFRTVARRALDDDCEAAFPIRASFSSATFRSFWPQQDDAFEASISTARRIRT